MSNKARESTSRHHPFLRIVDNQLYTLNLTRGTSVYDEELIDIDGAEYRSFTPRRSKLAATIKKGIDPTAIRDGLKILYLGAANGTTVSHISDMMPCGRIFAVEISPRSFRDLLALSGMRKNVFPILADASVPAGYRYIVGDVDLMYQDISQRNQVEIFLKNAAMFLRPRGIAYLMVKANCIDSARPPRETYAAVRKELIGAGFIVKNALELAPYQKDHMAFILKNK